jgi:hypothetical protein
MISLLTWLSLDRAILRTARNPYLVFVEIFKQCLLLSIDAISTNLIAKMITSVCRKFYDKIKVMYFGRVSSMSCCKG